MAEKKVAHAKLGRHVITSVTPAEARIALRTKEEKDIYDKEVHRAESRIREQILAKRPGSQEPDQTSEKEHSRHLGLGDFAQKDERSDVHSGRQIFMDAVRMEVPSVLRRLAGQPLEDFQQLAASVEKETGRNPSSPGEWSWPEFEDWGLSQCDRLPSLFKWARTYYLTDAWCIAYGMRTLTMWYRHCRKDLSVGRLMRVGWDHESFGCFVPTEEQLENKMCLPTYNFTQQIREAVDSEIRQSFENQLESYYKRMEDLAEQGGWVKKSVKHTYEDFRRLAWYQCGGAELADIHDYLVRRTPDKRHPLTTSTIRMAIIPLAAEIGLTHRRGKQGRRPKDRPVWRTESGTE